MKALVGAFNQEKAIVGAFSVIVQPVVEPMDRFAALIRLTCLDFNQTRRRARRSRKDSACDGSPQAQPRLNEELLIFKFKFQ